MQPQGRKPKLCNFVDNHPPKGYKNWWDDICDANKAAARQLDRKLIMDEIGEWDAKKWDCRIK